MCFCLYTTSYERIHHLPDHRRVQKLSEESINSMQLHLVKSLRTYILPEHYDDQLSSDVLKCYSLWVLDFVNREKLSSSIGDLKHLRHLNLSRGKFKTLPESLIKLWNLQILKLDGCHNLKKFPNSLIRLKALQQLSLNGCDSLHSLPRQIGKLTFLRILSMYFVGNERGSRLVELGALKHKGDLEIKHLGKVKIVMDAKEANMSSNKLNKLVLSWDENEGSELQENVEQILEVLQPDTQQLESLMVEGYKGAQFPQWMSSSPSLKKLEICRCSKFNVQSGFQCLEYLRIERCKEVQGFLEVLQHMTALQTLYLSDFPNLESLPDCSGNLPLLHRLYIFKCDKLRCLPTSLNLSSLQYLNIDRCREAEGLLEALQHMIALKKLILFNLENLESLPDCFGKIPLLRQFIIRNCSKLRCLPMSLNLSSLQCLSIYSCSPELEKRCEKETGDDWPKIAHIPHIHVR